ncbi:MAG: tRNA pseudouridine(55) synthase TruB [Steroidobacteraceae bacterium]
MTVARPKRFDRGVDGILLLDKPQGVSSNAALQQARGLFRALKAGHAGSLDPLATGMLPICFGQATKVCGYLLNSRKTYRVAAKLGSKTDSADADGVVIEQAPVPELSQSQIEVVLQSFLGAQLQVPPMYSALKQQGRRLYELARSGEVVEREPRNIVIERIQLRQHDSGQIEFEVRCSKGTYVRSLVEDVAARLGTLAHVSMLRRVQVDPFEAARMVTLEQLESLSLAQRDALLQTADVALQEIPLLNLDAAQEIDLFHGKPVAGFSQLEAGLWRAYGSTQRFLGLVRADGQGQVCAERLFPPPVGPITAPVPAAPV